VDPARGLLYIDTGNNYSVPAGVCTTPDQTGCTKPAVGDYVDSILTLRLSDGAVAWADHTVTGDLWTLVTPTGPDFDFGSGGLGGIEYGTAADGQRIYAADGDTASIPYTPGGSGPYAGQTVTGGSWAALDPATGKILWQTPDPAGALDIGFVSAANGVVYGGSLATTGTNMYALDAATRKILWSFASGGSVTGGAAIAGGSVYWGSGYCGTECFTAPVNNNKVYGFSVG
jgi:polyvinyl alcohol dehydrogenase (cytochrome)